MSSTWVALLRAINVGGRNKLPMADLRALAGDLGWRDARTYIASGNLAFEADGEVLPQTLAEAIAERFGLSVPVVLRRPQELRWAIERRPEELPLDRLRVVFLSDHPSPERAAALPLDRSPGDRYVLSGKELYVHYGAKKSRLTMDWIERQLGVTGTQRNWRTLGKLLELAGD